jgi:hypothetical protein
LVSARGAYYATFYLWGQLEVNLGLVFAVYTL